MLYQAGKENDADKHYNHREHDTDQANCRTGAEIDEDGEYTKGDDDDAKEVEYGT